jgi:hypothetical protein
MVVPTSIQLIEDVRKAPDDVLDEIKPFNEVRSIYAWPTHIHTSIMIHDSSLKWITSSTF